MSRLGYFLSDFLRIPAIGIARNPTTTLEMRAFTKPSDDKLISLILASMKTKAVRAPTNELKYRPRLSLKKTLPATVPPIAPANILIIQSILHSNRRYHFCQ